MSMADRANLKVGDGGPSAPRGPVPVGPAAPAQGPATVRLGRTRTPALGTSVTGRVQTDARHLHPSNAEARGMGGVGACGCVQVRMRVQVHVQVCAGACRCVQVHV